jgi:hypothetical protein
LKLIADPDNKVSTSIKTTLWACRQQALLLYKHFSVTVVQGVSVEESTSRWNDLSSGNCDTTGERPLRTGDTASGERRSIRLNNIKPCGRRQ